jgi:hypothetical protein
MTLSFFKHYICIYIYEYPHICTYVYEYTHILPHTNPFLKMFIIVLLFTILNIINIFDQEFTYFILYFTNSTSGTLFKISSQVLSTKLPVTYHLGYLLER